MPKTIVVNATAANTGGALTILLDFLSAIEEQDKSLDNNKYIIFTSVELGYAPSPCIEIINFGKKRYFQRFIWDYIGFDRFLRRERITPDLIISFQNTGVKYSKHCPQLIYFHNPFSLLPEKWNPFVRNERLLWFYTFVYPFFVKALITKNTTIVVQAEWIKKSFSKKFTFSEKNIHVIKPDVIGLPTTKDLSIDETHKLYYFFPSTAFKYKNHELIFSILDEIEKIEPDVLKNITINLTLTFEDIEKLDLIQQYNKWCENIALLGYVGKEEIVRQFNSCRALLFPSRIETLGLPLLEAASLGKFIIASDLIYARETLSEYENVDFVDPKNPREWGIKLIKTTKDENVTLAKRLPRNDSWASFIKLIHTIIN